MFARKKIFATIGLFTTTILATSSLSIARAVKAQELSTPKNCVAFQEVTTNQTEIRKQIKNSIITKDNWNTDFAIPAGTKYDFFVGQMIPENDANYEISVNLKYPDGSNSTVYNRNVPLKRNETYSLTFQTPTEKQPYQVNVRIGGANNNAYTIAVLGCE